MTTHEGEDVGRRPRSWSRVLVISVLALGVVGVALVVVANLLVVGRTSERITRQPDDLDPAQVAIVPGAGVYPDGSLGRPVEQRVRAALELYDRGLVEKILVSGDNGTPSYNEPDAMRDAVLEAGVPAADVFTDYAGFSTWHTMRRARDVFEADTAIVVTQGVYAARTVDLGVAVQPLQRLDDLARAARALHGGADHLELDRGPAATCVLEHVACGRSARRCTCRGPR